MYEREAFSCSLWDHLTAGIHRGEGGMLQKESRAGMISEKRLCQII